MEQPHPSSDIRGTLSVRLAGKRVVLCVTGSVAAVRSPDIARLLMRHGAEVIPVMSPAACRIIHPDLMHWATGNATVTELTGAIEHVAVAGNVSGRADVILVAPATANTIGKIAAGIDDTPVTTVVTTGIGQAIPLVIVPAMHEPMYRHPLVAQNIAHLEQIGVRFVMPRIEEGKAKIASDAEVLSAVEAALSLHGRLAGTRFLVSAGRTVEYLDPVRVITNNSSGKMGIAVALAAAAAGAEVTLICGKLSVQPPPSIRLLRVETAEQMSQAVEQELAARQYDVFVAAAAVGDWKPEHSSQKKISTHEHSAIDVRLVPTPKIIDRVRERHPELFLVAFRALAGLTPEQLITDAHRRLIEAGADLIAVNEVTGAGVGFESDTNELYFVDEKKTVEHVELTSKRAAATRLIEAIARRILKTNGEVHELEDKKG